MPVDETQIMVIDDHPGDDGPPDLATPESEGDRAGFDQGDAGGD